MTEPLLADKVMKPAVLNRILNRKKTPLLSCARCGNPIESGSQYHASASHKRFYHSACFYEMFI